MAVEKVRVQLDFTTKMVKSLDRLREISGAGSRAGVIREALKFYSWVLKIHAEGKTILSVDKDGNETRLVIL